MALHSAATATCPLPPLKTGLPSPARPLLPSKIAISIPARPERAFPTTPKRAPVSPHPLLTNHFNLLTLILALTAAALTFVGALLILSSAGICNAISSLGLSLFVAVVVQRGQGRVGEYRWLCLIWTTYNLVRFTDTRMWLPTDSGQAPLLVLMGSIFMSFTLALWVLALTLPPVHTFPRALRITWLLPPSPSEVRSLGSPSYVTASPPRPFRTLRKTKGKPHLSYI